MKRKEVIEELLRQKRQLEELEVSYHDNRNNVEAVKNWTLEDRKTEHINSSRSLARQGRLHQIMICLDLLGARKNAKA